MTTQFAEDNFEDNEDEGFFMDVKAQDREEQAKIQSKFAYLCRPPVDPSFNEQTSFTFMQIDVDYYFNKGKSYYIP